MAAGLLELLFGGGMQNPRLGGEDTPAGGGLLDALGQRIMQQQMNPQMGGAAPVNAQPQPQAFQAPQSAGPQVSMPQEGGGVLGRLFSGAGQRQGSNQTVDWLVSRGVDPGAAPAIAANPQMLRSAVAQLSMPQGAPKQSEYQQRQQALIEAGIDPNSEQGRRYFLTGNLPESADKDARKTYGNEVIWAQKPDGAWAAMRTASDGSLVEAPVTEGLRLAPPGAASMDLGTKIAIRDRAGNIIRYEDKDVAGEAAQSAVGKGAGEAQLALPGAEGLAEQVKKQVIELSADPYLPNMVGPMASRLPNITGDAARVQAKMDQLQGGAFMQAREMLKGGGQITDYEGRKAEEAYARLAVAQNVEDYKKALQDFNMYVDMGLKKLRAQASMGGGAQQPAQQNDDPLGIRMR